MMSSSSDYGVESRLRSLYRYPPSRSVVIQLVPLRVESRKIYVPANLSHRNVLSLQNLPNLNIGKSNQTLVEIQELNEKSEIEHLNAKYKFRNDNSVDGLLEDGRSDTVKRLAREVSDISNLAKHFSNPIRKIF